MKISLNLVGHILWYRIFSFARIECVELFGKKKNRKEKEKLCAVTDSYINKFEYTGVRFNDYCTELIKRSSIVSDKTNLKNWRQRWGDIDGNSENIISKMCL